MTRNERIEAIKRLFVETGKAHHDAFIATDGDDPDWPIWYADHLQQRLSGLIGMPLTRSRLIYCIMFAEFEREARSPEADWAEYYARHLVERLSESATPARDELALYYFPTCPFCIRVLSTIERLGLEIDLRNIRQSDEHWNELVTARGRATVPVLRISTPEGEERWMPESADIIQYLEHSYPAAA